MIRSLFRALFGPPPIPANIEPYPRSGYYSDLWLTCVCGEPMFRSHRRNGDVEWLEWYCSSCNRIRYTHTKGYRKSDEVQP